LVEYLKEQKKIHQDKAVERSGKKVQKKSQRLGPASVFDPLLAKSRWYDPLIRRIRRKEKEQKILFPFPSIFRSLGDSLRPVLKT
jgi:hypothetical protein